MSSKRRKSEDAIPPPCDLEAEAAVVSAVFVYRSTERVRAHLDWKHFHNDANAWIYRAQSELEADGKPIDVITVKGWLDGHEALARVGGVAYLARIIDATPFASNIEEHASIVREKWRQRTAIAAMQRRAAEGYGLNGESSTWLKGAIDELDALAVNTAATYPDPGACVDALSKPATRLRTGLSALNDAFRGGIPTGQVVTFVGAPGSCKTTLAFQVAAHMRAEGAYVVVLAYDEDPGSLLTRFGRHHGLTRQAIEAGHAPSLARLKELASDIEWLIIDGMGDDPVSVDAAVAELVRRAKGRPMVLLVDSIQRAWVEGLDQADGPRLQIDMVVRALRRARSRGILVLATSEASRGLYRSKDNKINPLAAAKESGAIEYRSDAMLVLDAQEPDDPDGHIVISGTWAKNRLAGGRKETLWFVLDRERSMVSECEPPIDETPQGGKRREQPDKHASLMRMAIEVEKYLSMHPNTTGRQVCEEVKGKAETIRAALDWLLQAGRVHRSRGPGGGNVWSVITPTSDNRPVQVDHA